VPLAAIEDAERPATDGEMKLIEDRFGAKLPETYRAFLRTYNGGTPVPANFYSTHNVNTQRDRRAPSRDGGLVPLDP
jgi:hypothetical protein